MSFNKITLVGNLGRDPELRYTQQGVPVCTFSLAINEKAKSATGDAEERTTWFRITTWNALAETVYRYLGKGREVYVEGRLSVSEFTDRNGVGRYSLDVRATDVQFLSNGGRPQADEAAAMAEAQAEPVSAPVSTEDSMVPESVPMPPPATRRKRATPTTNGIPF
jgi:single-strand DNA-binding protein